MGEEKAKKLVTAAAVAATLFAVLLLMLLVYQLITMAVLNRKKASLQREIDYYTEQIELLESDIDRATAAWYIEQRARELGMLKEGDIVYGK